MPLNDNAVIIPGRGTVFYGPPSTQPPNLDTLDPAAEATYTGWTWLGHTSRDNQVGLSKSGGEKTTKGTWWNTALRATTSPTEWDVTVNALQVDIDTLGLAFPGGTVDANGMFLVPDDPGSNERALFVWMIDSTAHMGLWWPKVDLGLGDAPSIDVENFFEIQLAGKSLSVDRTRMGIIPPRPLPTVEVPATT